MAGHQGRKMSNSYTSAQLSSMTSMLAPTSPQKPFQSSAMYLSLTDLCLCTKRNQSALSHKAYGSTHYYIWLQVSVVLPWIWQCYVRLHGMYISFRSPELREKVLLHRKLPHLCRCYSCVKKWQLWWLAKFSPKSGLPNSSITV